MNDADCSQHRQRVQHHLHGMMMAALLAAPRSTFSALRHPLQPCRTPKGRLDASWKSAQLSDPCYERHVQDELAQTKPSKHACRCRPQLLPHVVGPQPMPQAAPVVMQIRQALTCHRHLVSQCGASLYSVPGIHSVAATTYLAASSAPRTGFCTWGTAGAFPFPRAAAAVAAAAAALCCSRPKCSSTAAPSCSMQHAAKAPEKLPRTATLSQPQPAAVTSCIARSQPSALSLLCKRVCPIRCKIKHVHAQQAGDALLEHCHSSSSHDCL